MLQAILNKFWKQRPIKQQLYGHLPSISKSVQIRRARSKQEHDEQVLYDQREFIYNSSVRIKDIV